MRKIGGSYQFFALLNGVNVRGTMGVINGPLRQQYKKGTSNYFPDWETSANKPIIFAKLLRDDTGSVLIPTSLKMFYNDVEITFDSGTGLSTNASMAGFFKKASRAVTVGSSQYNMLTVEIVKNLIPISSFDNDTIRLQGTVEIAGQTINFDAITSVVEIIETVGQSTTIYLEGDTDITNDSPAATIRAHALIDGTPPANLSAYVLKWYDVKGTELALINTGSESITIPASAVDGTKTIRCELKDKVSNVTIAIAYINIMDFTDPYRVYLYIDGVMGEGIGKGETMVITAKVEKSDGTEDTTAKVNFVTLDNKGKVIPELTGEKKTLSITYAQAVAAGGGGNGYVSATILT